MNYQRLSEEFEKSQCKLLTTEEEMKILTKTKGLSKVMVKILAICGHENQCVVTNFRARRTGILCKDCRKVKVSQTLKTKYQENIGYSHQIEHDSFLIVTKYLQSHYEIYKTNEGCKADMIIRPLNSISNDWIAVQLKARTQKSSVGMYSFTGINKNYDDHIIICVCMDENKIWVLPFDTIKHLKTLNISIKSKYNEYLIDDNNNLHNYVQQLSKSIKFFTKEEALMPISTWQQQEQIYATIRTKAIPSLQFVLPKVEQGKVDFYVNNLKVQEKISSLKRGQSHFITISANNGKDKDKCRKYRTYRKGEIDIYWFNLKDSSIFYVIPEHVLYDHKLISGKEETTNKTYLFINTNKDWLEEFKYDYNNVDESKLKSQFGH